MVTVQKATGEKEQFSEEKVRSSIRRAGIPQTLEETVISHVQSKLYDGIPTSKIYHHITEFLGKSSHPFAKSKYSLKQSIMRLGPTGYPFEDFVAEILKTEGYTTKTRQTLAGNCIQHEIDVLAEKDGQRISIEAKFHNAPGTKTSVHVSLYTKARFDDIKDVNTLHQAWIVTNTKMTLDAITYAQCNNIKVLSWNYPAGESLRDRIEKSALSPLTILTTLPQQEKQKLLNQRVVLCKDLARNPDLFNLLNLPSQKKEEIKKEISFVCPL